MTRDFITLLDHTPRDLEAFLDLARRIKHNPRAWNKALDGKSFALIFQKPSNRTRVSFETGIYQLGGKSIYLAPDDISLGKREPTADIARTLSRYVSGIVARVFAHNDLVELSRFSSVPVINALSDLSHPCQAMADMMTVLETFGRCRGLKFAYIGDGNNMTNALMVAACSLGMEVAVATPKRYTPDRRYIAAARERAHGTGGSLALTNDPSEAAAGAHVVYTDTWVSMGQEAESAKRLKHFRGYQVDDALMAKAAPNGVFMHCLPAHRGQEVSASVIDGPRSVVFDEAENRLHIQKAILVQLLTNTVSKTRRGRAPRRNP